MTKSEENDTIDCANTFELYSLHEWAFLLIVEMPKEKISGRCCVTVGRAITSNAR